MVRITSLVPEAHGLRITHILESRVDGLDVPDGAFQNCDQGSEHRYHCCHGQGLDLKVAPYEQLAGELALQQS